MGVGTVHVANKPGVFIQDQTTQPLDLYFIQAIGAPTTSTGAVAIGDVIIPVTSAASISVGNRLGVFSVVAGENRFYFGQVTAVNSLNITVDTPFDFAFGAASVVQSTTRELDVDGSSTTQVFTVNGPTTGAAVDITRIMIQMECASAADLSTFGDLTALTNGIVLRRNNGVVNNIWNVKKNSEFSNLAFDFDIFAASNPSSGIDGLKCRYTFAGQDKHGVAVRLATGETLEVLIQDDITGLDSFHIIAQGHLVDE
jgi:hypothetical protein